MNITERNQNRFFWILQFAGWGFINLSSVLFLKKLGLQFMLYNLFSGVFVGVLVTSLLRAYLKKRITLERFTLREFGHTAWGTLAATVFYGLLSFAFGYAYSKYGPEINNEELAFLKAFDSYWALAFSSIFIIGSWVVCYLVIKLLLKLNKDRIARLQMSDTLKEAQLNTLKGQINPHFMFNSLNNIRGLMLEDVEKSREMLTKLSEMLRYSLTKNSVDGIAVEEELEMVHNYIALSKIQFEDRLTYTQNIYASALSEHIPPMLIQLLVENAAKHGIANLKEGGTIHLEIRKNEGSLAIVVTNTGSLEISKGSTQLGLKNIRERLKILHGAKANFSLTEEDRQVVARINIPLV